MQRYLLPHALILACVTKYDYVKCVYLCVARYDYVKCMYR